MVRKLLFIISILVMTTACESEKEAAPEKPEAATTVDSIQTYRGNFISVGNAAVLKGDSYIYQVKIDSITKFLKEDLENYSLSTKNIVPIEVEGKVVENPAPAEGYSQMIEIKEINEIFAERKAAKKEE